MCIQSKVKIFQVIQRHYADLGICSSSNQLITQKSPFNGRLLFGFLLFGYFLASQLVHIFCIANGFLEYMEGVGAISATILVIIVLMAVVFRKTTIFKCIEDIEKLIDTSKPKLSSQFS